MLRDAHLRQCLGHRVPLDAVKSILTQTLRSDIGVAEGTLNISVAYQGLPIYSEVRDLCDMTTCPIQKGDLLIAYDQYLPPIVPPVRCVHPAPVLPMTEITSCLVSPLPVQLMTCVTTLSHT